MADDELTRKIGKAIVVVTTPDVCKAPTVPTPFVSYSKFDLSIKTADTVRMTRCVSFTKESRLSMTMADQGGVGGGLKSQVFGGMCRPFKGWSTTVRAQGSEICRHDVIMEVNCAGPEGPGNTFGKVIYIESLCCASVTPAGEIVVEEDDSPSKTDTSDESSNAPKPGEKSASDEVGELGSEMKDRASQRWEETKQAASDAYDYGKEVYEDPGKLYEDAKQAGKDAWEATKREAGEVWEKGPVDYTKDEVSEAWENSQAKKDWESGNYGGAMVDGAIEAGKWLLGVKGASKVAEKMPLPKRRKKRDGDHDSNKTSKDGDSENTADSDSKEESKKDENEEKSEKEEEKIGDSGEATGEDGGVVKALPARSVSDKQRKHILDGDKKGGGHRHGTGKPGKSEFPQEWSDDKIISNIEDVANDPGSIRETGKWGNDVIRGTRDGIDIEVIAFPEGHSKYPGIITGYPTNTPPNPM